MARFLVDNDAKPQALWFSPKKRTQETAGLLADALNIPRTLLEMKKSLGPNELPDVFLEEMIPENWKQLLVISHLPFLQSLTSSLLETPNAPLSFPSAGLAALEKIEDHAWQILWSTSPSQLQH